LVWHFLLEFCQSTTRNVLSGHGALVFEAMEYYIFQNILRATLLNLKGDHIRF
jgi:hypothetical protein